MFTFNFNSGGGPQVQYNSTLETVLTCMEVEVREGIQGQGTETDPMDSESDEDSQSQVRFLFRGLFKLQMVPFGNYWIIYLIACF